MPSATSTQPAEQPIRLLIIDDHRLFNDGLAAMLGNVPDVAVVGQVYHSREAIAAVHQLCPDLLLIDFNMPHLNGLELTQQLLRQNQGCKVLILSMYNEARYINDFCKAGAKGYLLKTANLEEVLNAIRRIRAGGYYFEGHSAADDVPNNHTADDFLKTYRLTPREVDVLRCIKQGLSSQQVADRLCVSFHTVDTHRKNIHVKLQLKGQSELFAWLAQHEL